MVNKKRKTLPKSPDRPAKAPKEPKTSAPPVSGTLVAVEGGRFAFSPAPSRKKLASEPSASPSSSSISFPASQESESSEGISPTTPRNTSSTIEPELEQKPLSLPFPPAFRLEAASPEEARLIPTTLPPHVEHAANTPPTLSQTLDKEPSSPTHASTHVEHTPASIPNSDQPEDPVSLTKMLLLVLQGQQALLSNSMKMEQEIASLKEDNKELRSQLYAGLNQLAKIVTDKNTITNQSITAISDTYTTEFDTAHKNTLIVNDNIKKLGLNLEVENQAIMKKVDSIEKNLTSATVEQKLDNLEKIIENLQPSKADTPMDTPMDMTPTPRPPMPLPSTSPSPRPHHRQSKQPTYASISGQNIAHDQSYTWLGTTLPTSSTVPKRDTFSKNTWTIRFPGNSNFERPELAPQLIITRINRDANHTNIKATLAKWTLKRNLSITFSPESNEKDILDASTTIFKCLNINQDHAIFAKSVNWSKIVFKNTPCQTVSMTGEYGTPVSVKITDKETLLKAVQESHPLLKEATFVHPPDWTIQTLPEDAIYHNLRFTIEDPDSSIANNLIESDAIMFATSVRPRLWKDHSAPIPAAHATTPY